MAQCTPIVSTDTCTNLGMAKRLPPRLCRLPVPWMYNVVSQMFCHPVMQGDKRQTKGMGGKLGWCVAPFRKGSHTEKFAVGDYLSITAIRDVVSCPSLTEGKESLHSVNGEHVIV